MTWLQNTALINKKNQIMKKISNLILLLLALMLSAPAYSQQHNKPRVSPPDSVAGMINQATIKIHYSSPFVKGRKIWGALVPYDSVWRAGANEATTFQTDKALKIGNQLLPAGKYSFFLVPVKPGKWIAIFNTVANQWGAFKYDKTKDQIRVNAETQMLNTVQEKLVYRIMPDGFSLAWDQLSVFIPVQQKSPETAE
jgi:hypothetical protein